MDNEEQAQLDMACARDNILVDIDRLNNYAQMVLQRASTPAVYSDADFRIAIDTTRGIVTDLGVHLRELDQAFARHLNIYAE